MKRSFALVLFCLALAVSVQARRPGAQQAGAPPPRTHPASAQTTGGQQPSAAQADAPATKEDVEAYFAAAHTKDLAAKMLAAMSKPMHQMMHDTYLKNKEKLPPDFEARMDKQMDDMFNGLPFDEMIDAMVPSYQKHFTKGDMAALTAFYSSATGQKILKEMPAITAESLQNLMPLMQKYTSKMQQQMQQQVAEMLQQSAPPAAKKPAPTAN